MLINPIRQQCHIECMSEYQNNQIICAAYKKIVFVITHKTLALKQQGRIGKESRPNNER